VKISIYLEFLKRKGKKSFQIQEMLQKSEKLITEVLSTVSHRILQHNKKIIFRNFQKVPSREETKF